MCFQNRNVAHAQFNYISSYRDKPKEKEENRMNALGGVYIDGKQCITNKHSVEAVL